MIKKKIGTDDEIFLTIRQVFKVMKAIKENTDVDIIITETHIKKFVKQGGSLWTNLMTLGTKLLPFASNAAAPLATGALSGLGSLGIDKIFGKGQKGVFLIPQNKIS